MEGCSAFPEAQLTMVSQLHEVLLSEITVAGMNDPPAKVRALFESFFRQLSLPRLVHFFDLVLAQMIPRWETSAGQARSRLVCHVLRLWDDAWHRGVQKPNICSSFRRQFVSRAGIDYIAVHWQHNEVLLFTDPEHVELLDTNEFRSATALEHHRKNVQFFFLYCRIALDSCARSQKRDRNSAHLQESNKKPPTQHKQNKARVS